MYTIFLAPKDILLHASLEIEFFFFMVEAQRSVYLPWKWNEVYKFWDFKKN